MSISNRLMFSAMFNHTWSRYFNEKVMKFSNNQSDYHQSSGTVSSTNSWLINRFTIVQRSGFILALIVLFWIIFIVIYLSSRLILRLISNVKYFPFYYDFPLGSNEKICRAFVISSNQYGSFRPTHIPSPLLPRSDSLFPNNDLQVHTKPTISLNPTSRSSMNNASLLEHYLTTYNPLKIDLTNINEGTVNTSIVKDNPSIKASSDTDTRPMRNCYAFNCTNKQGIYHSGRYVRLQEQENCSATASLIDDRLSDCSTKLTSITLPMLMVTDCSDNQRLHTDIIELNESEKDKE